MVDGRALRDRLSAVRERIASAARRAGRDPGSVSLVAVSKTFSADHVRAAAEAGQREFGENRVQEAQPKITATADLGLRWHLVGHLQSNKARKAAQDFHVIHSVDNARLVAALDAAALASAHHVDVLVQIDLANEPTKHGARPEDLMQILETGRARQGVTIRGLMLLPPAVDDPEDARRFFVQLRELRDDLVRRGADPAALADLSMGMSHDFDVAVEEGSTIVRVGTAIFGERPHV